MTVQGTTVSYRLDGDTLSRVAAYRERLQARVGTSARVRMSDALREIVLIGLHAAEHDETRANQS